MKQFAVETRTREELRDITADVQRAVDESGQRSGICVVSCPHTTAGVTINESSDPAVASDLSRAFEALSPSLSWSHAEGNSPAHLKATLVGAQCVVGLVDGALSLGRWQGIFLCEFDGPRKRIVQVWFAS
jgi:secondary thiamine-phosphate synthase enzyme